MSERYAELTKIPAQPAAKLLAFANCKLETKLKAPASASVQAVLEELEDAGAYVDIINMLSCSLPPRERIWWGCLAARELVPEGETSRALAAAEKWVFQPSDDTREAARQAAEMSDPNDDTSLAAVAVAMHDGKLGGGELQEFQAPPGATAKYVFGLNLLAMGEHEENFEAHGQIVIDRALDIARGGNGTIEAKGGSEELAEPSTQETG